MRATVEAALAEQIDHLTTSPPFRRLESGEASQEEYDGFLANLIRAHLRSPSVVAFLYALAPPAASDDALDNLLEELGIEDESGVAHPAMLCDLAEGAGLLPVLPALERLAAADLRDIACEPLLYLTLREVGLSALCEVVAFELMLSRLGSRIERLLETHRGLPPESLTWFHHHAEVDVAHAEQGLEHIESYVRYYGMAEQAAHDIIEMTLRENVFIKRYFGRTSPTRPSTGQP